MIFKITKIGLIFKKRVKLQQDLEPKSVNFFQDDTKIVHRTSQPADWLYSETNPNSSYKWIFASILKEFLYC